MTPFPKTERILALAQALTAEYPTFFQSTGPGIGDRATTAFMRELRTRAMALLGEDCAERQISGPNRLAVDFYISDEATIIEVAMGLRNPASEFERDILKALMAQEARNAVTRLIFISKPGAIQRLAQPSSQAIIAWAARNHQLTIDIHEFTNNLANNDILSGG